MDLFDALELGNQTDGLELLGGDSSAKLYPLAIPPNAQFRYFETLLEAVPWEQHSITVYGKTHLQPRLVAWYGDPGKSYSYSGIDLELRPWIPPILELKAVAERMAQVVFNSVLLNLYRNGDDTVGWHSDDERELGPNPIIASVSLGAERRFDLRNKSSKETVKVLLPPGSILVMTGRTQAEWAHQLPRTKKVGDPRINLTFRRIRS